MGSIRPHATSGFRIADACAEGMSHRAVAGVATHCSPSMRPLAGHPHAVWLTHAHPATVHCMPALPLSSRTSPSAHCASPLAGGSAGAIHAAWLARAAHAGKMPTLPAASSATVHVDEAGLRPST